MSKLTKKFQIYDQSVKKENPQYSALLGKTPTVVEHPTRNGHCYARMADNLNELITVFNDKVSQVYNLPVIVERRGNNWYVVGRDSERYQDWGTESSFLPKHANQHEFNREGGTGADAVFIYPDQLTPLLVYPSGTSGAGTVMVAPYLLQRDTDFVYVGNTGTGNLLLYKPTTNQAIIGLVYLDKTTGNPGLLINSGTPFAGNITGSAQIVPYLPYPNSNQEPLYFVRLVSGTTAITWNNLYNARQFIGGYGNGSSSTGSSYPPLTGDRVVITDVSGTVTTTPYLQWDSYQDDALVIGGLPVRDTGAPSFQNTLVNFVAKTDDDPVYGMAYTWGDSSDTHSNFSGVRAGGTRASPTGLAKDKIIHQVGGYTHDGVDWSQGSVARVIFKTTENQVPGSHGAATFFEGIATGTETKREFGAALENGFNVPLGSTFNIDGVPHNHSHETITGLLGGATNDHYHLTSSQISSLTSGTKTTLHQHDDWNEISETWTVNTQAYTNDPSAGSNITLNMTSTALFAVGDHVVVSSSAGQEIARIGSLVANTSITVNALALNHTTSSPVVIAMKFTVPSDATTRFSKFMKIRYKQGGAYKYAYARSVAATLITLIGNSDYIITNVAITDIAYSYSAIAQDFPVSFNFISIITYAGGTTDPTSNTIDYSFYRMLGTDFAMTVSSTLVRGTGNRASTRFSLPITANSLSPLAGIDSITAAGSISAKTCYATTTLVVYAQTMANDGNYWINGSFIAT